MVFDVFPTVLPVISLPAKPTEITTTDWGTGYDKAYILKYVSDSATSSDKLLELNLPVLDESLGTDTLIQHEAYIAIVDLGSGIDLLSIFDRYFKDTSIGEEFPAKILLELKEYATGSDLAILGVGIFGEDSAIASEVRLSPIPIGVEDESYGKDLLKFIEKICKDIGSGIELSELSLLAKDLAEGYDIVKAIQVAITKYDSAIGSDIRLSPVFISVTDLSSGYSALSIRGRVRTDSAIGVDIGYKGYLVRDISTGYEFVKSILRTQKDVGHGLEIRLSPIPIKVEDISKGLDIGKLVYREYLAKDEAIGYSIVAQRISRIRDIGHGLELAVQTILAKEIAKGFEKIIGRSIQIRDSSFGVETRLSPIPLWLKDTSKGVERLILDKEAFTKDVSTGIEKMQIKVPLPTQYEVINIELSSNVLQDVCLKETISNILEIRRSITVTSTPKAKEISLSQVVKLTNELKVLLNKVIAKYIAYIIRISSQLNLIQENLSRQTQSVLTLDLKRNLTTKRIEATKLRFNETIPITQSLKSFKAYKKFISLNEEFKHYIGRGLLDILLNRVIELQESLSAINKLTVTSEDTYKKLSVTDSFQIVVPKLVISKGNILKTTSLSEKFNYNVYKIITLKELADIIKEQGVRLFSKIDVSKIEPIVLKRFEKTLYNLGIDTIYLPSKTHMSIEGFIRGFKIDKSYRHRNAELYEGFILSLLGILRKVFEAYKQLRDLELLLGKFRYVGIGDPVFPEDINLFYDAFKTFLEFAKTLYHEAFKEDEDILRCIWEIQHGLKKFKKVWLFEIASPKHRNQIVDLIMKARKFLETAWEKA